MNVSAQPANVLIYPQLVTTALKRSTSEVMPLVRVRGRQGGEKEAFDLLFCFYLF